MQIDTWTGHARTNSVRVQHVDDLREAIRPFQISLLQDPRDPQLFSLVSHHDHGGWDQTGWESSVDANPAATFIGVETGFDFVVHVMPYLHKNEVLIALEIGSDGNERLTGKAEAFVRWSTGVQRLTLDLNDIVSMAANAFAMPLAKIRPPN